MDLFLMLQSAACGGLPQPIIDLLRFAVNLIKIGVPIILVVYGMLDFGKAVFEQKEEDIKKAQQLFIKRLISALAVFLVVLIVQWIVGVVASTVGDDSNAVNCLSQIFGNTQSGDN